MDLAIGARDTFVMTTLLARDGVGKIVPECTYPLTGVRCVNPGHTDLAVYLNKDEGVTVRETYGIELDELAKLVPVPLRRHEESAQRGSSGEAGAG